MITKTKAEYVDQAAKAWCYQCTMFRIPNACTLVQGEIKPHGHCKFWRKKSVKLPVEKK